MDEIGYRRANELEQLDGKFRGPIQFKGRAERLRKLVRRNPAKWFDRKSGEID